ncbi:MAG TPA: XRE family transcriptional regulator [Polyangiaceae bacterium]|nr:XRE family transcriptional regulator [Polyangiaceae bacterium]
MAVKLAALVSKMALLPVYWQNSSAMSDEMAQRLGQNIVQLRQSRGFTQLQMAKLANLPRATWALLESGTANPTLTVLQAAAAALQVNLDELLAEPKALVQHYPRGSLPSRRRGSVTVSSLLPDNIPGTQIERIELPPGARLTGVPHTFGSREYLSCESGEIELVAGGTRFTLKPGDVVVFRGDQRHSYANLERSQAIGFSVVLVNRKVD